MEIFIKRALFFVPLYFAFAFLPVLFGAGPDLHATYFSKGISLAFVILFGPMMGLLVLSGQFLVASIIGISFMDSLILACISASFTVIGGLVLKRLRNSTIPHDHKALIALFCLIIFVFHPIAVASARLLGYSPGEDLLYLLDGWLAYGNGQVVVTPLVLVSYSWYRSGKDWSLVREALIWTAIAGLLTLILVWAAGYAPAGYRQLTIGLLIPFFIILSLRKEPLPVCSALFSSTLVVCLVADLVPVSGNQLFQDHVVLHLFMIGLNISALLIVSFSQNERELKGVLRESDEQYRLLFKHMDHGFLYARIIQEVPGGPIGFTILLGNDQYGRMVGIDPERLEAMEFSDLFPSAGDECLSKYLEVARTGIPFHGELYSDVIHRHVSVTAYRPKPDHVAIVVEDITDRVNAEILLKKREREFSSAFHGSNIGVCLVDLEGNFILVNEELCRITGYSKSELEGMNGNRITHPEDRGMSTEYLQSALIKHMEQSRFEKRYMHKNGYPVHCSVSLSLVKSEAAEPLHFVAHIKDISIRKAQEEQIWRDNEKLSRLNAMKNKLLSIIGHDLKNPVGAIRTLSGIMNRYLQENRVPEAKQLLQMQMAQGDRTYHLLADLLQWARAQQGESSFVFEEVELNELIRGEISALQGQAENKRISLDFQEAAPVKIAVDPNMIRTVVRNLVSNAIKYSYEGGKVVISAAERFNEVLVSGSDSGKGIPADTLATLFTSSSRISTPGTANETGTGFGLPICKEFIELHKGQIWAESQEGQGSVFYFTLPKTPKPTGPGATTFRRDSS